jgi:hypothetical protein
LTAALGPAADAASHTRVSELHDNDKISPFKSWNVTASCITDGNHCFVVRRKSRSCSAAGTMSSLSSGKKKKPVTLALVSQCVPILV